MKRLLLGNSLAVAISDELWAQTRLKAAANALGATMLCQFGLIAVSTFHPVSALIGADLTIFVGVATFIGAFLWRERD